jgi:hypothetical protein
MNVCTPLLVQQEATLPRVTFDRPWLVRVSQGCVCFERVSAGSCDMRRDSNAVVLD